MLEMAPYLRKDDAELMEISASPAGAWIAAGSLELAALLAYLLFPSLGIGAGILFAFGLVLAWSAAKVDRLRFYPRTRTWSRDLGWGPFTRSRTGSFDDLRGVVICGPPGLGEPTGDTPETDTLSVEAPGIVSSRLRSRRLFLELEAKVYDPNAGPEAPPRRIPLGFPMGPRIAPSLAEEYAQRLAVPVVDEVPETPPETEEVAALETETSGPNKAPSPFPADGQLEGESEAHFAAREGDPGQGSEMLVGPGDEASKETGD